MCTESDCFSSFWLELLLTKGVPNVVHVVHLIQHMVRHCEGKAVAEGEVASKIRRSIFGLMQLTYYRLVTEQSYNSSQLFQTLRCNMTILVLLDLYLDTT